MMQKFVAQVQSLFFKNNVNLFILPNEMLSEILKSVSLKDLGRLARVCHLLKDAADDFSQWNSFLLPRYRTTNTSEAKKIFLESPSARISNKVFDKKGRDYYRTRLSSKDFLTLLVKENIIDPELADEIIDNNISGYLSEIGIIMLTERLIKPIQAAQLLPHPGELDIPHLQDRLSALFSPNGLIALREKLISPVNIGKLYTPDLLTGNGLKALREKLFTPEKTVNVYLVPLLTENGLTALKEKLIKVDDLSNDIRPNDTSVLFTDNGLKALRNKLISPKQIMHIDFLNYVLSDNGLIALSEKLITSDQIVNIRESRSTIYLTSIFTENGLTALREHLIDFEIASTLFPTDLEMLLTNDGLQAMRERLINAKCICYGQYSNLELLLSPIGIQALREELITDYEAMNIRDLNYLLTENGLMALRDGLISPYQASLFRHNFNYTGLLTHNLEDLLTDTGIKALKEGLITPEKAAVMMNFKPFLKNLSKFMAIQDRSEASSVIDKFNLFSPPMKKRIKPPSNDVEKIISGFELI